MATCFENFLLIDSNAEFSRDFVTYQNQQFPNKPQHLIVAGENTRHLVKMMFDNLIKDYCYCDFANEISVTELAAYLLEHHQIAGVVIHDLDFHLANEEQRAIFNALHPIRYLVEITPEGYNYSQIQDVFHENHLSCHSEHLDEADRSIEASLCKLEND
ncbi:hypothetical protein ABMY35_07910 [Pseudoalteromonas sp. BZB3]|uniref:hypothetical protein n=1 Tax=Pseudoalteromonas sp. BZB3 TaxID=3136670 RepID=UPI0032C4AA5E|tara:strand:+ start:2789 stop:3265 length:477 start_codon:yes stop_codon:yes gene_type:complete